MVSRLQRHSQQTSNIVINGCDIIAGDDALAFSGYSRHYELPGFRDTRRISENVTVSNCLLQSRSSGIRVGGIDQNSLRNYRFDTITIYDSNRGVGVFVHQDGSLDNIHFSNMTIQTRLHTGDWWGNGEPIHISVIEGAPVEKSLGRLSNISFTNIRAEGEMGILVYGDVPGAIKNLDFRNVDLTIRNGVLQNEYGGNIDLRPAVVLEKNIFRHDIPGLFVKHATDVTLRDFQIQWDREMHSNFKYGLWSEYVNDLDLNDVRIPAPRDGEEAYFLIETDLFER